MATVELTGAEREYLETLFWLYEAGLQMTGANVARAMRLSAPTVHEMIGRLERGDLITRGPDKVISFTAAGERQAEEIVGRHRLIERFLTDVLGIPWDEVHEEAERLEHAMSPVLEQRMLANNPTGLVTMAAQLLKAEDRTDDLAARSIPTFVLYGEDDNAWPTEQQRDMAARLNAERICIPAAAHNPNVEAPATTAHALTTFWNAAER